MTTTAGPAPDEAAWADIRTRYEAGDEPVAEIARAAGFSRITLSLYALKHGWKMRGKKTGKARRAKKGSAAKHEATRDTILRLKDMLQQRVSQLEHELREIGSEVDALSTERGIKSLGLLVRTIEKVMDLERKDKLKRKQATRQFKYFDDQQRQQLAAKIARLEEERERQLAEPETGNGRSDGAEQPVALLGEAGPATAAGGT
jgi:hypothetical protein